MLESIFPANSNISAVSTTSIPQATINHLSLPTDTEVVDSAETSKTSFLDYFLPSLAGGADGILDPFVLPAINATRAGGHDKILNSATPFSDAIILQGMPGGAAKILDLPATPAISDTYAGGAAEILDPPPQPAINETPNQEPLMK